MSTRSTLKPEVLKTCRCAGCGDDIVCLKETTQRQYCSNCRGLGVVKERWQPFGRGIRVVKAFSVKDR